ncbi:hypothetical protein PQS90_19440 [Pseudomonas sp. BLCC-B13]|uniref:hypothetical protein n=1 Tax=Pseudomonas sp. BLCC-B13 TaxID=3025314 RepID=UPI00234F1DB5|nr:hypothetical protein [Pseudomonas sp. BLCC-B13]MDC7827335.1 hypothetical protein [Pseudomonas sp. BLCC-B13]
MRAKISVKGTFVKHADGASSIQESPEELDLLSEFKQAEFDDWQVKNALSLFREHRDLEPLLEQLLESNPGVLRNHEALQLIADAARGKPVTGRGKVRTAYQRERDLQIWTAAFYLRQLGFPVKNDPDKIKADAPQKPSVCRIISQYLVLNEGTIYTAIREYGGLPRERLPGISFTALYGEGVTSEVILDHYLSRYRKCARTR